MGALVESEALTEGPPRVGSRWRDVFEDRGHRIELEAEIAELIEGERLSVRLGSSAFRATSTQRLEAEGGRTRLTTTIETEYLAPIARLFAGVVTRHAQAQLEADHAALKELVEREAARRPS